MKPCSFATRQTWSNVASVNFWPRGCRIWRNISTGCLGWVAKLDVAYFGREKVWTTVFVGVIRTFFKHILHTLVVFSHFPQLWKAVGGKIKTTQGGFEPPPPCLSSMSCNTTDCSQRRCHTHWATGSLQQK